MNRYLSIALLITSLLFSTVFSRKHQLILENDVRKYFSITTFGFFNDGQLEVNLNYLTFLSRLDGVFGLTLTKTVSDSITPYMESHQNKCLLSDETLVGDGNVEIVSFVLDMKTNQVIVNCSNIFTTLEIRPIFESNSSSSSIEDIPKVDKKKPNAAHQIIKQKRSAEDPSDAVESAIENEVSKALESKDETVVKHEISEPKLESTSESKPIHESKMCTNFKIAFKNDIVGPNRQIHSLQFIVLMKNPTSEGLYSLYFHNCAGYKGLPIPVNLSIAITEKNGDSYLSAGEIPLPKLYFIMSLVFFITGCVWISVLKRKREETFKIHYLMGLLVFVKSLSLLFHGINFHIIAKDGYPMEAWAVLYYITHLLKGALLFITIVLIGTGWAFIKHILSDKDKKIFMIVIPLQVLANVAKIIMEESEEGESQHYTWREVFILVDLVCCGAILFPVVWSIRHLQEASQTDGKAAINLEKLKLFRHFYIMIVCYIYFTRIIVYLLKITVPFQYEWLDEMFKETATLIFFILTGYNFRPTTSNPYFRLSLEDDLEMDEVLTQTGFTEGVTKTVRARDISGQGDSNITTKRESSHEYD